MIENKDFEKTIDLNNNKYTIYSISEAEKKLNLDFSKLPFSLKILLENLLRNLDGRSVTLDNIKAFANWQNTGHVNEEIVYRPTRVLMQDFTGVPAVVDLAAMRHVINENNDNPQKINPLAPVDLVIDHSIMIDYFGNNEALKKNEELEFERNAERYSFLRWGQSAFKNFRVVPPSTGICHQVNLEYLAKTVWTKEEAGKIYAYPDTVVGTDSHTTMVNGLTVLGWGVGGIEAEAVMLGQPISMLIPDVVGFELYGKLQEGVTATDLVLRVTEMLREKGVVGKFIEYFGEGLKSLSLPDRATIANMAPEYGATCGIFPTDEETLNYMRLTGRDEEAIKLVEAYTKEQGLWLEDGRNKTYSDTIKLDLNDVVPAIAGPKRPQDRILLSNTKQAFAQSLQDNANRENEKVAKVDNKGVELQDGAVMIAAITSCTNTSNPSVLIGAGLLAKNAVDKGLKTKPWVKTSLAPGSLVVADYLRDAGLQDSLDTLGFTIAAFGCTTCIGNSGPLDEDWVKVITDNDLYVSSVLSGNRNFEGRVNPHTKANYLASPILVVAYALAGNMNIDLTSEPIGVGSDGKDVYLKDIWPSNDDIKKAVDKFVTSSAFAKRYANVFKGTDTWQNIQAPQSDVFDWDNSSTYVRMPSFFDNSQNEVNDIKGARPLLILSDSITTDHISPAGAIREGSPAAKYLNDNGVMDKDFNSYGSRRGNHEVMMRGTFANIRIRNEMLNNVEGGYTKHYPTEQQMSVYDAAMLYQQEGTPLVVIAGKEYGTGSSRDWAAKGTKLLGVKAVVVESFERIHRSNLVGMGILPLQFAEGYNRKQLNLNGSETFDIIGLQDGLKPQMDLHLVVHYSNGSKTEVPLVCRIDTIDEVEYYENGGILNYVLKNLMA